MNTSPRDVPLFCCQSVNPFLRTPTVSLLLHLTRPTTLLLAPNGKVSWNMRELARNAVLAPGLSEFKPQRQANSFA